MRTKTELLRDLAPFRNLECRAPHPGGSARRPGSPVFYGDVAWGVRLELTLPERCSGLSASSLLMLRPDGGWEVFGDDGLLATYDAGAVLVSMSGTDEAGGGRREPALVAVQV
jgi:hypothetical protein